MNIKFDTLMLRAFALLLGFLLWFHVATERRYDHELTLPLAEISLDQSLTLAETPPDSVTIVVSASGKKLLRQKWQRQGLRLTASQFAAGRHTINLSDANLSFVEPGTELTIDQVISPNTVMLHIEPVDSVELPVEPGLTAEAAEGYTVTGMRIDSPAVVTVIGARSRVNQLKAVFTADRDLAGLDQTDSFKVAVRKPDIYHVRLRPDSAIVIIDVAAIAAKRFEDIPVVVFNKPSNRQLEIIPKSIWVELVGAPAEIDGLRASDIAASVDYAGLDSTAKLALHLDFPAGLTLRNVSDKQVRILTR